ncbi:MAG: CBS domain-containing protein [Lentimicrobiaceae bacterium]|jgi:predicted transcriptional regulator|nr:CBS domain-containing protein [Lentimicrobiaceae bacterium]MDD4598971.1 CBS domain-containing protein [Lentimicrobiaceae bacterium]MDY0027366.1 CBS domain-containing protein [Lentimicrobium sp.]HAH59439.1 hypothetical protein [Bacteroidales bacterium]
MSKKNIFSAANGMNRNTLAIIVIILSIGGIISLALVYFFSADANARDQTAGNIFNTLLPVITSWVGTVLAFYFGRENFEAASNRYEQMITKLSPDVLDDVLVEQIMIDKNTMIGLDYEEVKDQSVDQLIGFMEKIKKSRLPVLEKDGIKYIVHKSTFRDAKQRLSTVENLDFETFSQDKQYHGLISTFLIVAEGTKLESVRNELKTKTNIRDVFVVDKDNKLIGWLTDSQILKYMHM